MQLEGIYYMFVNPIAFFERMGKKLSFVMALFVVFLAMMSTTIGETLIGIDNISIDSVFLLGLMKFISIFFIWIIIASLWHLFAELLDGQGKANILFIALGFCFLPAMLSTPLALIAESAGKWKLYLFAISNLFILFWIIRLQVISIREIYKISNFRALIVLTSPITLGLILIGIIGIASLLTIIDNKESLLNYLPLILGK